MISKNITCYVSFIVGFLALGCQDKTSVKILESSIRVNKLEFTVMTNASEKKVLTGTIQCADVSHQFRVPSDTQTGVYHFEFDSKEFFNSLIPKEGPTYPLTLPVQLKIAENEKSILDTLINFPISNPPSFSKLTLLQPNIVARTFVYKKIDFLNQFANGSNSINGTADFITFSHIFEDTTHVLPVDIELDSAINIDKSIFVIWPEKHENDLDEFNNRKPFISFESHLASLTPESYKEIKSQGINKGRPVRIRENLKVNKSGVSNLFLVLFKNERELQIIKLLRFLVDDIKPQINSVNPDCVLWGDPRVSGVVCIAVKEFFGNNPYKVPFEGVVRGDVSQFFMEGERINFTRDKPFFFKKSLYLDGGYNRVNVRILDKQGNVTDDFIPITLERMLDH